MTTAFDVVPPEAPSTVPELAGPVVGAGDGSGPSGSSSDGDRHWWRRRGPRRRAVWVAIAFVVAVLVLIDSDGSEGPSVAYDFNSTRADGMKGLVLLGRELGAQVDLDAAPVAGKTAFLPVDDLTQEETDVVERWVRSGGRLVVADVFSSLSPMAPPETPPGSQQPRRLVPSCPSALVAGVGAIEPSTVRNYDAFSVPASVPFGVERCFPVGSKSFLVSARLGQGSVLALGSADVFANELLDHEDNAVLAAKLLDLQRGTTVTMLHTGGLVARGDAGVRDLLPGRVKESIWQLGVAAVLLLWWRGRRFGRPVEEVQPVAIAGSQLVVATGNLLQTAGRVDGAARTLRRELRRSVATSLGLPFDVDPEALVQATSTRTGVEVERLRSAMLDRPLNDSKELVQLAQLTEDLYQEITRAR